MSINDGGAAFPIPLDDRPGAYPAEPGMSLRDYIAARVVGAAMVNASLTVQEDGNTLTRDSLDALALVARVSYAAADAMLAQRDRK